MDMDGSLQRVQAGSWPWPGAVFVVAAMALVLNWCLVVTTCLLPPTLPLFILALPWHIGMAWGVDTSWSRICCQCVMILHPLP